MKAIVVISLSVLSFCLEEIQDAKYFNQLRSHFHVPLSESGTFSQRYWVSDEYWNSSTGPIFLYICGEGECRGVPSSDTFPKQMASHFQAKYIALEHRYYGESLPYEYSSMLPQLFSHLMVEEALSDIAYFINQMNSSLSGTHKWIIIGGSYAGAVSAWFRTRYPDLVVGSWASSAVVRPILDFTAYDKQIYTSAMRSGQPCVNALQTINAYLESAYDTGNMQEITSLFNVTADFETVDDKRPVLFYITDMIAGLVQYGRRTDMCNTFGTGKEGNELLGELQGLAEKYSMTSTNGYSIASIKSLFWEPSNSYRQWYWQKTTQLGWFQTPSQYKIRPSALNITYWEWFVNQIFDYPGGLSLPDTEAFDPNYKGTNIIFLNGIEDPWQWASVSAPANSKQVVQLIDCDDCGHCVDLGVPSDTDSQALKDARALIQSTLETWFSE